MRKLRLYHITLAILTAFTSAFAGAGNPLLPAPVLLKPADQAKFQPTQNLELQWSSIPGTQNYSVEYATDTTFKGAALVGSYFVSGTTLTISDLKNDTYYFWRVRSEDYLRWSDIWSFKTTGLPVTPTPSFPSNNNFNTDIPVDFKWQGDSVNAGYQLQISKDSVFTSTMDISSKDTTEVVGNIEYSTQYYWRVKSYNSDFVYSAWSDVNSFRTRLAYPNLIFPADNSNSLDTIINFSWTKNDSANYYRIEIALDSLFTGTSMTYVKDTASGNITITNLAYTTDYFWRVYSYNNSGETSSWSKTFHFRTGFPVPIPVSPKDSLLDADTSLVFSWTAVSNAQKYRLQISTDTLFSNIVKQTVATGVSINIDSLQTGKYYYWHVNAAKNSDSSNWSKTSFFTTRITSPVLLFPQNDTLSIGTNINFQWRKIDSAYFYRMQTSYDSAFTQRFSDTLITTNSFNGKNFLNDTVYFWRVRAIRKDTLSGSLWSSVFKFKTHPLITILPGVVSDTINLSDYYTDTLTSVILNNYGANDFRIDKILAYPDTSFYFSNTVSSVPAGGQSVLTVKFNTERIREGLNTGKVYLVRKSANLHDDTLFVNISVFIKKAVASFSADNITFGNSNAGNIYTKGFTVRNLDGNTDLKIRQLTIYGTDTASFHFTDTLNAIPAGTEKQLHISFKPLKMGLHNAILRVSSNSYKDSVYEFVLNGYGIGGALDTASVISVNSLSSSAFDAFLNNNKHFQFKNTGNAPLTIKFITRNNYFSVSNEINKTVILYAEDTAGFDVNYTLPNFKTENKDTLFVLSNGFSKDTLAITLKGGFDTSAVKSVFASNIKINGDAFNNAVKVFPENSRVILTLPTDILRNLPGTGFRLKYITGGAYYNTTVLNDGSGNYIIPSADVNNKGFLAWGELYKKDTLGSFNDSISVIQPFNGQVLLSNYTSPAITIPRSKPAETADKADVKWKLIGFPFDNTAVDSVFKQLGGRNAMKDGEWILYKYNPESANGFSVFNDYYFGSYQGYFIAQSLSDSFKVSNTYYGNTRTRKLTDTVITFNSDAWKIVTDPFTFTVGVDPSTPLRQYDPERKTYLMTTVMKPGEAYFVEPSVSSLILKPYGTLLMQSAPKLISDIGWHFNITANDSNYSDNVILSLQNNSAQTYGGLYNFLKAPAVQAGLGLYVLNDNTQNKYSVSVQKSGEGAVWKLGVVNRVKSGNIKLSFAKYGALPNGFAISVFDGKKHLSLSDSTVELHLTKDVEKLLNVIIGTKDYIQNIAAQFADNTVTDFALKQNYPNPFNPATTIEFSVPVKDRYTLKVYNTLGELVTTLVDKDVEPGNFKINFNAGSLASGVYFYRLSGKGVNKINKMILLK